MQSAPFEIEKFKSGLENGAFNIMLERTLEHGTDFE